VRQRGILFLQRQTEILTAYIWLLLAADARIHRWASLPAAMLAHASALVGALLPDSVTAGMRVGPPYWRTN